MSDLEIVTGYRDIVRDICFTKEHMRWNILHSLPVFDMPEKIRELGQALVRFEEILYNDIQDRRVRNIICCRYALGISKRNTAFLLGISMGTVDRACADIMKRLA